MDELHAQRWRGPGHQQAWEKEKPALLGPGLFETARQGLVLRYLKDVNRMDAAIISYEPWAYLSVSLRCPWCLGQTDATMPRAMQSLASHSRWASG